MKNLDERIRKVLEKRGIVTEKQIEEYFSPSISFLKDPFLLPDMQKAVSRLQTAIKNRESVVIYGDYDADGVSASAILYLFLMSKGLQPQVFIPNRFEDGYGLSQETIEYISENLFPDLMITVDCGITALSEVELLSDLGIDVIVTDHHIPLETLPQAVAVVDPKIASSYGFDGLCGAGVVLKLVQAMGGKVEDYIDIAALATIGDIVPLVDENRLIASIGLKKINSASCNKGIAALKNLVAPGVVLTSQDVSFKLVPRINSTGRMRDSMLSFNLLVEQDEVRAAELACEIDQTNSERMSAISSSIDVITKMLKEENLSDKHAVIVCSKDFHQGVLGILASRLVGDYNLPAFVFHEDDNGLLKGSCRSVGSLDIHEILVSLSSLCENIGGHKMAAGLSIKKGNFPEFCRQLEQGVASKYVPKEAEPEFDFEIKDTDLTVDFARQVQMLEPTGCGNEALVLRLIADNCVYKQTSSPKHYQLVTPNKKYLMSFFGERFSNCFASSGTKVYFTVSLDKYNNEYRVKSVVKDVCANIGKVKEDVLLCAVEDALLEQQENKKIELMQNQVQLIEKLKPLAIGSGLVVVARTFKDFELAKKELNLKGATSVPTSGKSVVVYAPSGLFCKENLSRYKSVALFSGTLAEYGFYKELNSYSYKIDSSSLSCDRKVFADCFMVFQASGVKAYNNIYEYVAAVSRHLPYSACQIGFCLAVFAQLGIITIYDQHGNFSAVINKSVKRLLTESTLYNKVLNK